MQIPVIGLEFLTSFEVSKKRKGPSEEEKETFRQIRKRGKFFFLVGESRTKKATTACHAGASDFRRPAFDRLTFHRLSTSTGESLAGCTRRFTFDSVFLLSFYSMPQNVFSSIAGKSSIMTTILTILNIQVASL